MLGRISFLSRDNFLEIFKTCVCLKHMKSELNKKHQELVQRVRKWYESVEWESFVLFCCVDKKECEISTSTFSLRTITLFLKI